jgi:hypothetical protein
MNGNKILEALTNIRDKYVDGQQLSKYYLEDVKVIVSEWNTLFVNKEVADIILKNYLVDVIHSYPYKYVDEDEENDDELFEIFEHLIDNFDILLTENILEAMMYGLYFGKYEWLKDKLDD